MSNYTELFVESADHWKLVRCNWIDYHWVCGASNVDVNQVLPPYRWRICSAFWLGSRGWPISSSARRTERRRTARPTARAPPTWWICTATCTSASTSRKGRSNSSSTQSTARSSSPRYGQTDPTQFGAVNPVGVATHRSCIAKKGTLWRSISIS